METLTDKQRDAICTLVTFFTKNIESALFAVEDVVDELVKGGALEGTELNDLVLDIMQEQIEYATTQFNYHSLPPEELVNVFQAHCDLGYTQIWKDHHLEEMVRK
jgi:hypothetical protein